MKLDGFEPVAALEAAPKRRLFAEMRKQRQRLAQGLAPMAGVRGCGPRGEGQPWRRLARRFERRCDRFDLEGTFKAAVKRFRDEWVKGTTHPAGRVSVHVVQG